jgi:hypothetical protein
VEERIFTEMVWGFSAAWVLLVAAAAMVQLRGRRATKDLEKLKREVVEQIAKTAPADVRGRASA